jgi:prepilin-type N-terminal cleavage/methylation domain-containing protein
MFDQNQERGFTIIEIIAVLILIGILGAVVISRVTSSREVDLKVKAEQVKGHIRFAQMRAMNTTSTTTGCNAPVGMTASDGKYYMFVNCDANSKVVLPVRKAALVLICLVALLFPLFHSIHGEGPTQTPAEQEQASP